MNDITQETTADLVAEARRRGLPVPANLRTNTPAGFTTVDDPSGDSNLPAYAEGPAIRIGHIEVSSDWYEPVGIRFGVRNTNGSDPLEWTREELEQLPDVISDILEQIDLHAALAVLRTRPDLLKPTSTVNKLCEFAIENGLRASAMFAAYQELTTADEGN